MEDKKGETEQGLSIETAMLLDSWVQTHVQYAFTLADEMWSPLQVMYGILETFDGSNLTSKQKDDVEDLRKSCRRILNDLKELTHKEETLGGVFDTFFYVK